MALDPSWRPAVDEATIVKERTWLVGMFLTAMAYGIVFTLFTLSFAQLVRTTTKENHSRRLAFIIYISSMFILGTLFVGALAKMTQLSFIDARLFPGGPSAFEEQMFFIPINEVSNVVYVIANWLADGMMMYRYIIICKDACRLPSWVIVGFPLLAYLASIALSVIWLVQVSLPSSSPWSAGTDTNVTAPFFGMSLGLNITMTAAICGRLLVHRWRIATALGPKHGSQYTSIVAILIESSFLYSAFALLFLISVLLNNPIQNTFIQLLGEVQIIAPLLITYRTAHGEAWNHDTSKQLNTENRASVVQIQVESSGSPVHGSVGVMSPSKDDVPSFINVDDHELGRMKVS